MKRTFFLCVLFFVSAVEITWGQIPPTISYQGVLTDTEGAGVADGAYSLTFNLYNAVAGGSSLWSETQAVIVEQGIFNVILGAVRPLNLSFDQPYWLGVTVGDGAELTPRIELTASPYSLNTRAIPDNIVSTAKIADGAVTSGKIAAGQVVRSLNDLTDAVTLSAEGGATISTRGDTLIINAGSGEGASGWSLTGNSGITAANFIGTMDAASLNFKVNNERALRLEPNSTSPNVISGSGANSAAAGVAGATISGGGAEDFSGNPAPNQVSQDFGAIGGGRNNQVTGGAAVIAGGVDNIASGEVSAIGGGANNMTSGFLSTVAGGNENHASGVRSAIGGGGFNAASVEFATISGGQSNMASGSASSIGGGEGNQAVGSHSTIGGGEGNRANNGLATIAGGGFNTASGNSSIIAGGLDNIASGSFATVAGGVGNKARGDYSFVGGGGGLSIAAADTNSAPGNYSVVTGGRSNLARGAQATVSGGLNNSADNGGATVSGGENNQATGAASTVSGGFQNVASASVTTVGGGIFNKAFGRESTISGGRQNQSTADYAVVSGGRDNIAGGVAATVPGGRNNSAMAANSFAAGQRAKANHDGAFVWADATAADFASSGINQFLIRAAGGVGIGTNNPAAALHIVTPGTPPTGLTAENNGLLLGIQSTSGYKWIQSYGGPLAINPEGNNVGIGTTSPGNILTVQQNSATDPIADAWTTYSSRRWKTHIQTIKEPLEKIQSLRGVTFNWKKDGKQDIGLIAEEVGEVVPELVAYEQNGVDAKSVDYARLVALLIEGIKQQQQMIHLLERRVADIEKLTGSSSIRLLGED